MSIFAFIYLVGLIPIVLPFGIVPIAVKPIRISTIFDAGLAVPLAFGNDDIVFENVGEFANSRVRVTDLLLYIVRFGWTVVIGFGDKIGGVLV
jgi:hypothetical protein